MDSYSKNVERLQRMLQECDVLRCELCERSRDRKVKTVCTTCGKHVCKDHSKLFVLCITCHESASNNEESE